ncbi:MAG TPA: serine hydrolase domain-containing protein [Candidatus Baltobacteraceae bacterium]|jgi:CubicO group peptidase (beta-lactamase class C family)|nr:serine hydrolase domain-containing protein [Candidatus Baltobacteraceae bacterium]
MRKEFACMLFFALAMPPFCAAAQVAPVQAPATPPPFTRATARAIDAIGLSELHSGSTPGMAIGVVEEGLLVYARGFGFADLGTHRRATPATQFYAGSVSKQFTAAAVLLLVQDKKIALSDTVTKYVPELRIAKNVTIQQLLEQTSGLPDYTQAPGIDHDPNRPVRLDNVIAAVNNMQPAGAPGAHFTYNNFNYMIAALIVQRVSGEPFSDFLQSHIFQPLIMTSTFLAGDQGISPDRAVGYTRSRGRFQRVRVWNDSWLFGAGDIVTTVDDLAKWDVGLPLVLTVDSVREMWSAGSAPGGTNYGMGWVIDQRGGQRYLWHNGELAGFHSINGLLPDQHLAVIVLANADSLHAQTTVSPERVAARVLDAVAPLPPTRFGNVILQRADEWLGRLARVDIDRTQLTPEFSQYLTDQVVIGADLNELGPVQTMVPIESFRRSTDTVYVFDVRFEHGALRYQFALTSDGKIDGLLFAPSTA